MGLRTPTWDVQALLARRADLLLAALVVGIVAMMIIPLPTPLLDILITTNISFAVVLLLVSIYVTDALRIATFPSILLISTLFRLGLNVSSTRLILLQADAGEVIYSFGNFVVAGNLVVGVVVFLILTIIQFVVIAKGGERVAEVAARFTLDAMPGKQMAIDADLRAGSIDLDEARRQRGALQRESQLYGSMDGAMKFVKGDAIAAVLITIINIVGGLLIGVLQRKMALGAAATVYSLLTIGDGLVSQIPALLISIAAGIVVTRVASEERETHLGADIGRQVLAHPRAIGLAGGLLVLLAIIPGLPTVPFLLLGAVAGAVSFSLHRQRPSSGARRRARARGSRADVVGRDVAGSADDEALDPLDFTPPSLVAIEIGDALAPAVDEVGDGRLISELIPGLREMLQADLGVLLPGVHVRAGGGLPPDEYRILIGEVPLAGGVCDASWPLVMASREQLELLDAAARAEPTQAPGISPPLCRVPAEFAPALAGAGIQVVDPATQLALHLGQVLRTYAHELVGIQEAQQLLDQLERSHPALVHEVVPKLVSLQTLAEVLRRLVEEGISIRNLRDILQALAEWAPADKDPLTLTEHVRAALKRHISHRYAGEELALRVLMLDPVIEDAVRDSIQHTPRGSYLAMEPELNHEIVQAVGVEIARLPEDEPLPVILTSTEIRRYVRRLVEVDFPELAVLSYDELRPQVSVQPVARVSVGQS